METMDHSFEAGPPKARAAPPYAVQPRPALRVAPRKAIVYMVAAVSCLAVLDAGVKGLA